MNTTSEIYALLEGADPVVDAESLDTAPLIVRVETALGHSTAEPGSAPIPEGSTMDTGQAAAPATPTVPPRRRRARGLAVAAGTAVVVLAAVFGGLVATGLLRPRCHPDSPAPPPERSPWQ